MAKSLSNIIRAGSPSTPLPVSFGGTGSTTLTVNSVLLGNGTGAPQLVAPGTSGNILTSNGTTWTSGSLVTPWTIKTTNDPTYTAVAKDQILANTTGGAFTITLPATATANDVITIADYAGTFATNNLTINSNGLNLMGSVQTLVMDVNYNNVTLIYADSTKGWVITF